MNLVLWIVQWTLASLLLLWGLIKLAQAWHVDDLSRERDVIELGSRYVSRGDDLRAGLRNIVCAVGLVFPVFGIDWAYQGWVVPLAALLMALALIGRFNRLSGDWLEVIIFVLLLLVVMLRFGPYRLEY